MATNMNGKADLGCGQGVRGGGLASRLGLAQVETLSVRKFLFIASKEVTS